MSQQRPFSKLKKNIESLFDDKLKMEFCCSTYPIRGQWGSNSSIPRFYVKLGKEVIWDFPKDFELKEVPFYFWSSDNNISNLVREYIDTPVDKLLSKEFHLDTLTLEQTTINYGLVDLFISADRRLGKEKLLKWAESKNNDNINLVLSRRFQ